MPLTVMANEAPVEETAVEPLTVAGTAVVPLTMMADEALVEETATATESAMAAAMVSVTAVESTEVAGSVGMVTEMWWFPGGGRQGLEG